MNHLPAIPRTRPPSRQRGVALAVVLILLVVMMLLSLAALRGTVLQERMSSNVIDRGLSFQAAEAALREGEAVAGGKPAVPADDAALACSNGLCRAPKPDVAGDRLRMSDVANPDDEDGRTYWISNSRAATVNVAGVPEAPRYMIELIATGLPDTGTCTTSIDVSPDAECSGDQTVYRITARSAPANRADVTLQSTYIVP